MGSKAQRWSRIPSSLGYQGYIWLPLHIHKLYHDNYDATLLSLSFSSSFSLSHHLSLFLCTLFLSLSLSFTMSLYSPSVTHTASSHHLLFSFPSSHIHFLMHLDMCILVPVIHSHTSHTHSRLKRGKHSQIHRHIQHTHTHTHKFTYIWTHI